MHRLTVKKTGKFAQKTLQELQNKKGILIMIKLVCCFFCFVLLLLLLLLSLLFLFSYFIYLCIIVIITIVLTFYLLFIYYTFYSSNRVAAQLRNPGHTLFASACS